MAVGVSKTLAYLDIREFGAEPVPGFDNAAPILAAFTAAQTVNGATVFVPPGTWDVDGGAPTAGATVLLQGQSKVSIRGQTGGASIVRNLNPNAEKRIFGFVDCDDIDIRDLGFDGQVTTGARVAWNQGLDIRGGLRVRIQDCDFVDTGNNAMRVARLGIVGATEAIPHGTRQSESVIITGNRIRNAYGSGGLLTKGGGAQTVIISNNIFENVGIQGISVEAEDTLGPTTLPAGFIVVDGNIIRGVDGVPLGSVAWGIVVQELMTEVAVTNNVIENVAGQTIAAGVALTTSPAQSDTLVERLVVGGNQIRTVTSATGRNSGIELFSNDADCRTMLISGNQISGVDWGVHLKSDAQGGTLGRIKEVLVQGNQIRCERIGVWYNQLDGALLPAERIAVTGNMVSCNNSVGSRGVQLRAIDGQVSDNFLHECERGVGILTGGSADIDVNNNVIRDTTTAAVNLNGQLSTMQLGEHFLWVDTTNRLRVALNRPTLATIDTAGFVVGTQA